MGDPIRFIGSEQSANSSSLEESHADHHHHLSGWVYYVAPWLQPLGPGKALELNYGPKRHVSQTWKINALCTLLEAQREKEGASSSMRLFFRVNPYQKLPYFWCHHSQKPRLQCYVGLLSDPVFPSIAYFSRSIFGGILRRAPGGMLDTANVNGHHQRFRMGICDSLQY